MGLLEVKHGLLQMAESLDFLHNNARLIHRAISPEVTTSSLLFISFSIFKLSGSDDFCKLDFHTYSFPFLFWQFLFFFWQVILKKTYCLNRIYLFW
jgi:hypothetical protein